MIDKCLSFTMLIMYFHFQTDNRCRLKDLEEGKIGNLRVHRSGRVTLVLGDTVFEVKYFYDF